MNRDELLVRVQKLKVRLPNLVKTYPVVFWVLVVASLMVGFGLGWWLT